MSGYRRAIVEILAGLAPADAHWTVIWDEALRRGLVDPRVQPDARTAFLHELAAAARDGSVEKTSTGTYRLGAGSGPGG